MHGTAARTPATRKAQAALELRQSRRTLQLLRASGAIMLLTGGGWALFFGWHGAHAVAATEAALAVLGLAVLLAAHPQRVRPVAWLAFAGIFAFLCVFSALLDVPTAQIPRSSHLFLLVLAACAHHVFRGEPAVLRYGFLALVLAAFVALAAQPQATPPAFAIPDPLRRGAIWANLGIVAASLLVVLRLAEHDSTAHRSLHRALRDALARRHFALFYQPQLDADGRIVGAEALLRWHDPQRGTVAPGEFVPAAEETGFILPLGHWVLASACRQLQEWRRTPALARLRLAVNVSALQLQQPEFVPELLDLLARSGADPRLLTLELTESVLLEDTEEATAKMQALAAAGIRFSLDDFGTGWSSLSYLRRMPLSELKIDRAFTAEVVRDADAASITRNLLRLGHDLGIDVIAEGIESPEQHDYLRAQGCRLFQGYLFGRPMPAGAFERLALQEPAAPA